MADFTCPRCGKSSLRTRTPPEPRAYPRVTAHSSPFRGWRSLMCPSFR